jgi:hypothetical protein
MSSKIGIGFCTRRYLANVIEAVFLLPDTTVISKEVLDHMDNGRGKEFLGSMLGKRLHLHTTDARMFVGEFRCTDNVCQATQSS